MEYSTKISERMWNQPDKGELEAEREHMEMLNSTTPENFLVKHYISIAELEVKKKV